MFAIIFRKGFSSQEIIDTVRKKYSNLGPLIKIIASRGKIFENLGYDDAVASSEVIEALFLNEDITDDKDSIPVFVAEMDDIRAEFNEFKKQKDKKNKKQTLKTAAPKIKTSKRKNVTKFYI